MRLISELLTFLLVAILAMLLSMPAWAASCTPASLAGPWRLFAAGPAQDQPDFPLESHVAYDCRLAIARDGTLRRFRCTSAADFTSGGAMAEILQWSYARTGGSCWVRIHIGDRLTGIELSGQLTPDRQLVVGQGKVYDDPVYVTFQMVRMR